MGLRGAAYLTLYMWPLAPTFDLATPQYPYMSSHIAMSCYIVRFGIFPCQCRVDEAQDTTHIRLNDQPG